MTFSKIMASGFCLTLIMMQSAAAQKPLPPNYDEAAIAPYSLPDPLKFADGTPVSSVAEWEQLRRPQLLDLFAQQMFGEAPETPAQVEFSVLTQNDSALNGKAIRKEIEVVLATEPHRVAMTILLYVPKHVEKPAVFWGLNFWGNHTATPEQDVILNPNWIMASAPGVIDHRATEESRVHREGRWPIELIIDRGYAVATASYGDIDPDFDDGFQNGIQPAFFRPGQTRPAAYEWRAIAAWAWGLSRGLDVLEQEPLVDAKRVAVIGHSRLGKTALWAGAVDQRFAMVVSNNSGAGGAALNRRNYGERIDHLNHNFPHWFCGNFHRYSGQEHALPFDQHELIALMAPRPVYVASATEDQWADPLGEFLSSQHAEPVYALYGKSGLKSDKTPASFPSPDSPLKSGTIGYHLRTGKHDINEYDWEQYLDFADLHLPAK